MIIKMDPKSPSTFAKKLDALRPVLGPKSLCVVPKTGPKASSSINVCKLWQFSHADLLISLGGKSKKEKEKEKVMQPANLYLALHYALCYYSYEGYYNSLICSKKAISIGFEF